MGQMRNSVHRTQTLFNQVTVSGQEQLTRTSDNMLLLLYLIFAVIFILAIVGSVMLSSSILNPINVL